MARKCACEEYDRARDVLCRRNSAQWDGRFDSAFAAIREWFYHRLGVNPPGSYTVDRDVPFATSTASDLTNEIMAPLEAA